MTDMSPSPEQNTFPPVLNSSLKRKSAPSPNGEGGDRRKVSRACDSCKSKKTRCSGTKPCQRCARLSVPCEYNALYTRGRPPTPPSDMFGNEVEEQPGSSVHSISSPYNSRHSVSVSYVGSLTTPQAAASADVPFLRQSSPEPSSATDFEGHYLGPTAGITFLNRAWKRLHQDYVSTIPNDLNGGVSAYSSIFTFGDRPFLETSESSLTLPSNQDAMSLTSRYFDFAAPTYRFLHQGTVERWLAEIYAGNADNDEQKLRRVTPGKAAIILMIFATSLLYSTSLAGKPSDATNIDSGTSEPFFAEAQRQLASETGSPTLESVQARLQQCLYLLASSRANQSWYTFGTTNSLIMALGIHRKLFNSGKKRAGGYIKNECCKRVFWSAYTLDRYLSVMLGRPRMFQNEDIDQDFPDRINDEDMTPEGIIPKTKRKDCLMDAPVLHEKLAIIMGEISREIYTIQPIPEQDLIDTIQRKMKELKEWKKELPPILNTVQASSLIPIFQRQSTVLRLAYAHAVIHANRPLLLRNFADLAKGVSSTQQRFQENIEECINEAKVVVDMVNTFVEDGAMFQAFWYTQYISFCAVAVLYVHTIQQYQEGLSMGEQFANILASGNENHFRLAERCQQHLAEATSRNSPSKRYSIILEELRLEVHRQAQRAERLPLAENIRSVAGTMNYQNQYNLGILHQVQEIMPSENSNSLQQLGEGNIPDLLTLETFESWGISGWTQFDSWAYSKPPEDMVFEMWQLS